MKKLLVLLFSLLISFNSYGEWKEITKRGSDDYFYVDNSTIKKIGGYVYYWEMYSSIHIYDESGHRSNQIYRLVDCQMLRDKPVFYIFYFGTMGKEIDYQHSPKDPDWFYPPPGSHAYDILNFVCDYVK